MKNYTFAILMLLAGAGGCSKQAKQPTPVANGYFSYSLRFKHAPFDTVYMQVYAFDRDGKVISERFTNYLDPQHSYLSTFHYNAHGKVIREERNGAVFRQIEWDQHGASVYDSQQELIAQFEFTGPRLASYKLYPANGAVRAHYLSYDTDGNVVTIADETGIYVAFLDYDTSVANPFGLINSIGVLRVDYRPHFKNMFRTEKAYPYEGDDYSQPMRFYEYAWTLNAAGRVATVEDEKTLVYTSVFAYE